MKFLMFLSLSLMTSLSFGASQTISQCSVNLVKASTGVRVNLLLTDNGDYKANLIQGTTVSGTTYYLKQVSKGVFQGSVKNKTDLSMKLSISTEGKANQYISGFKSSLNVVYPDLRLNSGRGFFKSAESDDFVCGKKVSNF